MMLIPVRVGLSSIHGLGLLVVEPVARGTPIWRFEPGFDQEFPPERLIQLPESTQAHIRWFGWVSHSRGRWVLSGDHACFMNHDSNPNTGAAPNGRGEFTAALRDLRAGEELTCNYHAFDAEAATKLGG